MKSTAAIRGSPRPPEETGYENFVPDKASPYQDDGHRMAYIEKNKSR